MTHDPEAHAMNLLFPLLLTALAAAVLEFLLPGGDGSGSRMQGPIRTVVGLCILVALISPVREGISLLRHLAVSDATQLTEQLQSSYPGIIQPARSAEEYADDLAESLAATGNATVEDWVREALLSQFGIPAEQCAVKAEVAVTIPADPASGETASARITGVWITFYGSSTLKNPHTVEEWFGSQLGCPCYVSIG